MFSRRVMRSEPDPEVSLALEFGVWAYLAWRQNEDEGNVAWPSNKAIADVFGVNKMQITRAKRSLKRRGLLIDFGPLHRGGNHRYRVLPLGRGNGKPHHIGVTGTAESGDFDVTGAQRQSSGGHDTSVAAPITPALPESTQQPSTVSVEKIAQAQTPAAPASLADLTDAERQHQLAELRRAIAGPVGPRQQRRIS
jgi:hypothetical protein